jgi:hypothetical protein
MAGPLRVVPVWVQRVIMTGELPELQGIDLTGVRYPAKFAVAETAADGVRVLCVTDDQAEATMVAKELRHRGIKATAFRTE